MTSLYMQKTNHNIGETREGKHIVYLWLLYFIYLMIWFISYQLDELTLLNLISNKITWISSYSIPVVRALKKFMYLVKVAKVLGMTNKKI